MASFTIRPSSEIIDAVAVFSEPLCSSILSSRKEEKKMADIAALEHSTLKVPYEILNKKFRTAQKTLDREICHVTNAVTELQKDLVADNKNAAQISNLLGNVMEKLSSFKRKAEEVTQEEKECGRVVKRRVDHLKQFDSVSPTVVNQWKKTRLDRLLAEYLLRAGCYNTASKLVQARNIEGLTNLDIFLVAHEVEESLSKKDTSKCLAWCHDNKSKLRKLNSNLEFNVRVQEFVELIKNDRRMDAVWHARKYFINLESSQMTIIQQAMALIAFPPNTNISPYKELLSESRWTQLIHQFREENLKLYQICSESAFSVVLQAGLSALKTAHCYRGASGHNTDCPVCQKSLNILAAPLPYAHCSQSRLVCQISGEQLNENNQPLMLPNGNVYGTKALTQMASENNGMVTCPRTKQEFSLKEAEKVYVM